jgi:nitrogen-specific signal transduction histidine kinase
MMMATKSVLVPVERKAVLGIADVELAQKLAEELEPYAKQDPALVAANLPKLRERLSLDSPRAILLDDAICNGAPLFELLRQLTETAPVILLASAERQGEVSRLVAEGDVEFVVKSGDFVPLAASLVERRLRWSERSETALGPPWAGLPADEIFRHEINNPLTGILGNAELLLAHRDRLPAAETQRLQTVVDLAARLRETIRRLSNAWESQASSLKSA